MTSSISPQISRTASHLNPEGGTSYTRSLKERVVQVLTTGTLSDTFYASREQLATEAVDVLTQCRESNPRFLAKALVYARREGLMRTLPTLGLAVLAGGGGQTKRLFEQVFPLVINIPDDLRAFVGMCVDGKIAGRKGLGGIRREAVRAWIAEISEYHTVKYGSANSRGVTLRDILRMTHPRPTSDEISARFGWLCRGASALGDDPELNPSIRALEALKSATTEEAQIDLIRQGRLPFEVVVPSLTATTPRIWGELLRQAPYLNLLRNLNAFTRHEVFAQEDNVRYAVERLTDPRAIERSKALPFRFFSAWQAYCQNEVFDPRIADALRAALELSFTNMPSLGNRRVAIGTDVSGSMDHRISDKGSTRFIDIAGIFTGALLKRAEGRVIPLPFDGGVHTDHSLSSRDDIMVTAEKIGRYHGGSTAVGAPIQHLLNRQIEVDVFVGITDNEDWAYGDYYDFAEGNFLTLWRRYRKEINPQAKAYLVTIAPYADSVAPAGERNVRFIYGWNDQVLKYIAHDLEEGSGQIQAIESMDLRHVADPKGTHA